MLSTSQIIKIYGRKQCGPGAKCCRGADRVVIIDKEIEIERGTLNEVFN